MRFDTVVKNHIFGLLLMCFLCATPALQAQDAPFGSEPTIVHVVPLVPSGVVKDRDIVPNMKFKNKLIVGNDRKLAFRVLNRANLGVSIRKNDATIKLVSQYIVTSVKLASPYYAGTVTVWDNEPGNQPVVYHLSAGESITLDTDWYNTSRWMKFSWDPDDAKAPLDKGVVIASIMLARAQDFEMPSENPTPTIAQPTATAVQPNATPTPIILPTETPTRTPLSTPSHTPTIQYTPQMTPTPLATSAGCPGFAIQGYGQGTTGGCGGTVYLVTSLGDPVTPTPGTFRYYIQNITGPRIIKFAVSGTIVLRKDVKLLDGNVTIDGSDAPRGGVQFSGGTLIIGASNVILRHIRYLVGPYGPNPSSADNIRVVGDRGFWVEHVVLDHCSLMWAVDENFSVVDMARKVTVQWSMIAEGLYKSTHTKEDPHSMGALFHHQATEITLHHNLFAHNNYRNPQLASTGILEWTNNVVYNSASAAGILETQVVGDENWLDAVGNFAKIGPNFDRATATQRYSWRDGVMLGVSHIYARGNIDWNRTNDAQPDAAIVAPVLRKWISSTRFVPNPVPATTAAQAYQDVLAEAGATLPCRSSVDQRILREVQEGSGGYLNYPEEHGGWPDLTTGCN